MLADYKVRHRLTWRRRLARAGRTFAQIGW